MAKHLAVAAFALVLWRSTANAETCKGGGTRSMGLLQVGVQRTKVLEIEDEISSGGSKIIVIGDSNGQMSCGDISRFCGGSSAVNMAVGGSTAQHWTDGKCLFGDKKQGQKQSDKCPDGVSCCNSTRAFDPKFGSGYTHAWVTLGGNDFLDSKPCGSLRGAALQGKLESAIAKIRAAGPGGMKIVMTGYVTPSSSTSPYKFADFGCGNDPNTLSVLNDAIKAAVDSQKSKGHPVTFANPAYVLGATPTAWSPVETHADAIHLNSKGYCKMFSMPQMQADLGCSGTPCSSASCLSVAEGYSKRNGCFKNVGGCSSANPPPAPAPTAPSCKDDDQGMVAAAAAAGHTIASCADVVGFCTDQAHGALVREKCPKSCNACPGVMLEKL